MAYVGTPKYLGDDIKTLASIIQGEAGGEGANGMQAVASVIQNRAARNFSGYGSGLIDQALAHKQFQGQSTKPSAAAQAIAAQLVSGNIPDITGGALYYANPGASTASWATKLNGGNALKIGSHYFTDNAEGKPFTPAVNAVNAESGVPAAKVQSVNYVPPPMSGQQGNFQPLFNEQPQQAPAPQQAAPAVERAPLAPAPPQDDPLKAWGVDSGTEPAAPQQAPAPEQDILKAWGVDQPSEVANMPAAALAAAPAQAPGSIGQSIGGVIDKGVDLASKYGAPVVAMGNNLIRQAGTGVPVIGGALNSMDAATNALIAPAINPFLSKQNQLQGGTFGERYQNSLAMQNGQDQQFQADHPILSTGAQVAGGIGAMGGLASAVPAVGTALGMSGGIGARTALGAASGAILGGGDAAVRSGGDPEAIKRGAALGGGIGLVSPAAGAIIGSGVNKLFGGQIPERVAQLAQLARDKYGINIGPGQLSTNPSIKFLDSVVNRIPMSGGVAAKAAQQAAFNSAVANSFGETAKEVTPEVISAAKTRIGNVFNSVADRTPSIKADGQFATDLKGIISEAGQTLQDAEYAPLQKQMQQIVSKFADGQNTIDGATYQAMTRKGAPLDRAMQSNDPNVAFYAGKIRDALDGTLERSAPADVLSDLQKARSQWKALKTVEPLANKSATGDISPALLMTQAAKQYGNAAYGQGADLVDLGRIGQQFLKEAPSSGTAERSWLQNALIGGAGGSGALGAAGLLANPGALPFTLGSAAAGIGAARGAGALLRSPYIANRMIQGALGEGGNGGNLLLRATPQVALPQVNQRRPLELTVHPRNALQP